MKGVKVVHLQYDLDPETTPMFRYVAREAPAPRRQLRYGSQAKDRLAPAKAGVSGLFA
jgi:hypothetical protein